MPAADSHEDPLRAALPPATDYITYLTLLEYQLNPDNLKTLNGFLAADDGKLAEEIGWDLLRLVLPMIQTNPGAAVDCLELIAKRGNPREIVVRVAEEFEKLNQETGEDDIDDNGDDEDSDGLPTFKGEAARIHLGKMKLDGMPESVESPGAVSPHSSNQISHAPIDQIRVFQALIVMLSHVHPRIKTKFPSRFLATSLPAALGALRRSLVTRETTEMFISCLKRLSGNHRPALPPRASISDTTSAPVPLPDPEALSETPTGIVATSENEKAIVIKLLQAVALEVLEEYASALSLEEVPCFAWTSRTREHDHVAGRLLQRSNDDVGNDLVEHDAIVKQIVSLCDMLGLDVLFEAKKATNRISKLPDPAEQTAGEEEEPASDYPSTPDEVPVSPAALVLLLAAQDFYKSGSTSTEPKLIVSLFQKLTPLAEASVLPIPAVQDALNMLAYKHMVIQSAVQSLGEAEFNSLTSTLTQSFTTCPYPQIRDDAHNIVTSLLHLYPFQHVRMAIIKQTIAGIAKDPSNSTRSVPLAPPLNLPSLKAVGVGWLKDELSSGLQQVKAASVVGSAVSDGIDPELLETDDDLRRLIYPDVSQSTIVAPTDGLYGDYSISDLPFLVAVLNLSCVVFSRVDAGKLPKSLQATTETYRSMTQWARFLAAKQDTEEVARASDVYALEDACARLKGVLEEKQDL